ncbi:MAG: DNA-methyltransferase [Dermatophilaceae bacterium]
MTPPQSRARRDVPDDHGNHQREVAEPYHRDDRVTLHLGDCLDVLADLPTDSVHSVVTDPPYSLEFMGAEWDRFRVDDRAARWSGGSSGSAGRISTSSLTGSPLPAYTTTRTTSQCLTCGKRDAFRNSHPCDVDGIAEWFTVRVDGVPMEMRAFGAWVQAWAGECLRVLVPGGHVVAFGGPRTWHRLAVGLEEAGFDIRDSLAWLYGSGFPKSLDVSKAIDKAALIQQANHGPVAGAAGKWSGWGTALKPGFEPIMLARKPLVGTVAQNVTRHGAGGLNIDASRTPPTDRPDRIPNPSKSGDGAKGRWPVNVVLDEDQARNLDNASTPFGEPGASRFFYVPKAGTNERPRVDGTAHPTVKPLALMRWLVRLVTPPGGTVLEPFAGSGTTVEACLLEDFRCIAIEKSSEYAPLVMARIHRQRNAVEAIKLNGEDLGLFGIEEAC